VLFKKYFIPNFLIENSLAKMKFKVSTDLQTVFFENIYKDPNLGIKNG